jgi:hypothetical protein
LEKKRVCEKMEKFQVLLYKVDKNSDLAPFWPTNEYVDMLLSYEPQGYSAKFVKGDWKKFFFNRGDFWRLGHL